MRKDSTPDTQTYESLSHLEPVDLDRVHCRRSDTLPTLNNDGVGGTPSGTVTAEDLRPLLSLIRVPTDIFWGTADTMTPVSDAYVMKRLIPGSRLHLFQDVRHRVHRDRAADIASVVSENI